MLLYFLGKNICEHSKTFEIGCFHHHLFTWWWKETVSETVILKDWASGQRPRIMSLCYIVRKLLNLQWTLLEGLNTYYYGWEFMNSLHFVTVRSSDLMCSIKVVWYESYQLVRQLCLWLPLSDAYLLLQLKTVKQPNSSNESDGGLIPMFSISRFHTTFPVYMSCLCTQDWTIKNQCHSVFRLCMIVSPTTAQQYLTCTLFNK
jgi:hypothetical protein